MEVAYEVSSSAIFVGTIKDGGGAHLDTKMDNSRGKCLLPIQFTSNSHLGRKKVCHVLETLQEPVEGTVPSGYLPRTQLYIASCLGSITSTKTVQCSPAGIRWV
jgi:hypothetical protein